MQVIGVGGRRGAGKSTLIHTVASLLVDGTYALPRVIKFNGPEDEELYRIGKFLSQCQQDEYKMLANNHPRSEIVVLVDDVQYKDQVDLLHLAGGLLLYVDASRRMRDLFSTERQNDPAEALAAMYEACIIPQDMFHWHITNYHTLDKYIAEITAAHYYWTGAAIEGN